MKKTIFMSMLAGSVALIGSSACLAQPLESTTETDRAETQNVVASGGAAGADKAAFTSQQVTLAGVGVAATTVGVIAVVSGDDSNNNGGASGTTGTTGTTGTN